MNQQVRISVKKQIDEFISNGFQPKAPRSGLGLVIQTNTKKRVLLKKNGITNIGTIIIKRRIFHHQNHSIYNKIMFVKVGVNLFDY